MEGPRLQGTDGVRGLAAGADHPLLRGEADARRAFLERGLFTEPFAEHYAFAASGWLTERAGEDLLSPGAVLVAWDPRDAAGGFAGAVLRGALRSGAHVLAAGVLPTPAAAVYLQAAGAAGALLLTASHNPADQNGIKILRPPGAQKLLPAEDEEISRRVWGTAWEEVQDVPERGPCTDVAAEARAVYLHHMSQLPNRWLREGDLAGWSVVLDPARGAWSGLALEAAAPAGAWTREVNVLGEGPVNEGGGVVALEGRREVAGRDAGLIRAHAGLMALFEAGRARAEDLRSGKGFAAAGVFDADGDRAYTLVYDPFEDAARVLGGDEVLVLQARFLAGLGELPEGGRAVLTIESDAGAAAALAEAGLGVVFAPVGDKWILHAAGRWGDRFALGGEESGHTVVPGLLADAEGRVARLAVGDGLKSFLNTCAAVRWLGEEKGAREAYRVLAEPFPRGYKKSLYAYHVDRSRFAPGGEVWEAVGRAIWERVERSCPGGAVPRWSPLQDDPAVLYLMMEDAQGRPVATIGVRNSGTESRIGISLRGPAGWGEALAAAGGAALREILARMKDEDSPHARAEGALLRSLGKAPREASALDAELGRGAEGRFGAAVRPDRVRREAARGGLIEETREGWALTGLGRWYLEAGTCP
ncbi:MAG: hypothetical protein AABZ64_06995 [Nitrospinota bacterium]